MLKIVDMLKKLILICGWALLCQLTVNAQSEIPPAIRTSRKIMDGFMDLRFGMFIHFGPVTLRGTEIGWSRGNQVTVSDYDHLYKEFDPVLFNADRWVKAAKDAGMKYLVITAKHHDGFCLWPSAYTDYDIASTPFKKDVVGALAKACRKQGIKFGIYYSVLDWHYPDYPMHSNDGPIDPHADMGKYIVYMKNQLKELINRYHPFLFWFDGNWQKPWTQTEAVDMYKYIKQLDPDIIINNRLNGLNDHKVLDSETVGDYATPEQQVGAIDMVHPWESCITICHQWSWKPNDKLKSLKQCLDILASTSGGNGNLLLNVSPMLDGRMEVRQVDRLKEMGDWLHKYGDAIYDTHGGPYKPDTTFTATRKGNKINILLLQRPAGVLTLQNIPGCKVLKAYFMGGGKVAFTQDSSGIHLTLPDVLADVNCNVIVLELDKSADDIPLID
jgi:alpha-L-fucosidase